jgi:hypothetical protein
MATEQEYIDRTRRKVSDFEEPRQFDADYYRDALRFALSKLSFDLDETYSTAESVPPEHEFLVVKLAAIEMCHVRASDALESGVDSAGDSGGIDNLSELEVPDLRIEAQDLSTADVAEIWLKLAKDLQEEYDTELNSDSGKSSIATGFLNAFSYRTGGLANRRLDQGLPAVVLGATVAGSLVSLAWSILYHPEFIRYEIRRSTDNFADEDVQVGYITDNHEVTLEDEVSVGIYQYKVLTVNPNEIKIPSNVLEVTVV